MIASDTRTEDWSVAEVVLLSLWICLKLTLFVFLAQTEPFEFIYAGF